MEKPMPIAEAIDAVAARLSASAEQAWGEIKSQAFHGRLLLEGINDKGQPCSVERHWIPYIEPWGTEDSSPATVGNQLVTSDMPKREGGSMIGFDRTRAIRDRRAEKRDGREPRSVPPIRVRDVMADREQLDDAWAHAEHGSPKADPLLPYSVKSGEHPITPAPLSLSPNPLSLVPFGVILGQEDDQSFVELIEARWRSGKFPGPVLGRRGNNHLHEAIANYWRLEIQWVRGSAKHDYYTGEYDCEAYAAPSLRGWYHLGTDYYTNEWKDLATTAETLHRLRLLKDIQNAVDWHSKPVPDRAELERVTDALARAREAVRRAIWSREASSGSPRFFVKADRDLENEREYLAQAFSSTVSQGEIAAFAVEGESITRLPTGDGYWGLSHIKRAYVDDLVPNGGSPAICMVLTVAVDAFIGRYLAERCLSDSATFLRPKATRGRGRPAIERQRVVAAMVERYRDEPEQLSGGKQDALALEFATSPKTIRNARPIALGQIVPKSIAE
jgi:hypothetical protein